MAVRPRTLEPGPDPYATIEHEGDVAATKVCTPGRFIKTDGASAFLNCDAQGEACVGVATESMYPGATGARVTDFDDYDGDNGDIVPYATACDGFVLVEAGNQMDADPDPMAVITTTATGLAEVAAMGDVVLGVDPSIVTYGGVKFYRFRPAWDSRRTVA